MADAPQIEFRIRSISLLLGAFQALVLAVLLMAARRNAAANRLLAGLLVVIVLRVTPYIIGFAGFYDAYPWLTFAPFELSLAIGPLMYLYVRRITAGPLPRRWALHLLPAALQLGYYAGAFSLPLGTKWQWNDVVHEPWIVPLETAAALLSFGAYLGASWMRYRTYQRWLDENLSNREELRLGWLRNVLLACGALLVLWTGYACTEWFVRRLTYLDRFPLYLALALLVYFLALAGWRHAGLVYPQPETTADTGDTQTSPSAVDGLAATSPIDIRPAALLAVADEPMGLAAEAAAADADGDAAAESTYAELAARWREQVREARWWREESLTLAGLASRLRTSPRTLSRALNEGLGQSFNEFINRMRVEAVADELRDPANRGDVLRAAFDAGFSSKASFNRAFKAFTGLTPSAYREEPPAARLNIRQSAPPDEFATHDAAE